MLQAGGFKLNVQVNDYRAQWQPTIWVGRARGMMFGLGAIFGDPSGYLEYLFGPTSTRNHRRVKDPGFLRLYEKQQVELDAEPRRRTLVEIQRYLADKMWFVPFEYRTYTSFTVVRPNVRNFAEYRTPSGSWGRATESLIHYWLDT
jgi:ABC-type transport system substrate-binding protein